MSVYAYTCLYSSSLIVGGFKYSALVGCKKFAQKRDLEDHGRVVTFNPPQVILNNPGQYVFPGGKLNSGEEALDGAFRTFGERTGVNFTRNGEIPKSGEIGRASFWTYTNLPVYLITIVDDVTGNPKYSCAYIKTNSEQDLYELEKIMREKMESNDPRYVPSDELDSVAVLDLRRYNQYTITDSYTSYCLRQDGVLRTPKDLAAWQSYINDGVLPWPGSYSTTLPNPTRPRVTGVVELRLCCSAIKPFMEFMVDPANNFEFPRDNRGERKYSFIEPTEPRGSLSRFSTAEFAAMSEFIENIDKIIIEKVK